MKIISEKIELATRGNPDLINLTDRLSSILDVSRLKNGTMTVFVVGSTAAITTFEYEPGLIKDVQDLCEKIIPSDKHYCHDQAWGDANGYSHLRASLLGPSLTIPFFKNKLQLGTWQQVVLAEFDNQPRQRQIIIKLIGE